MHSAADSLRSELTMAPWRWQALGDLGADQASACGPQHEEDTADLSAGIDGLQEEDDESRQDQRGKPSP
jgi:hypothetical protein